MSKAQSAPAVRSGMPLWLWFILIVVLAGTAVVTVIALIPVDTDKLYNDGITAFEAGDIEKVKQNILALERSGASPGQIAVLTGLRRMGENRYIKAIDEFAPGIEDDATKAVALAYQGDCLVRVRKFDEARAALEQSIELDGSLVQARMALAAMYTSSGAYTLALEQLEALAEVDPDDARTMQIIGSIRTRMGQWEEAIAAFDECLKRDPRSPDAPDVNTLKAMCQIELGMYEECLDTLAAGASGDSVDTIRSEAFLRQGEMLEAIRTMDEALHVNERNPPLLVLRAEAAMKEDDPAGAYSFLQSALRAKPVFPDAHEALVDVCKALSKNTEAAQHQELTELLAAADKVYQAALPEVYADFDNAELRRDIALLAMRAGRDSESLEWLGAAYQLDPQLHSTIFDEQTVIYQQVMQEYAVVIPTSAIEGNAETNNTEAPVATDGTEESGSDPGSDPPATETSDPPDASDDTPKPDNSGEKVDAPNAEPPADETDGNATENPAPTADTPATDEAATEETADGSDSP